MRELSLRKILFFCSWLSVIFLLLVTAVQVSGQVAFNTILHDVLITPVEGQLAYNLKIYVSVLDEQSQPIRDLKADNFQILEDSQPAAFTVNPITDSEINLVLVVDTSGSMAGTGIQKARQAVQAFIDRLGPNDRISIITFSNEVTVISDFSQELATTKRQVATLEAVPGGGTCLYDAIYKAVQVSSVLPQGRRAVLVMTDGRDELPNGDPCSSTKIDDSIHLAAGNISTPVYSIGVGKTIDENSLQRIALLTGGSFLKADDFIKLDSMFSNMQSQLKDQYEISYTSKAAPGDHNLTVRVTLGSTKDEDTRIIRLAEIPPAIKISSPSSGSILSTDVPLKLIISGRENAIQKVQYEIDDVIVGESTTIPFGIVLTAEELPANGSKLTAKAFDSEGIILSSDSVDITIQLPAAAEPTPPIGSATAPVTPPSGDGETPPVNPIRWIIVAGIVLAVLALVALVFFVIKPFKRKPAADALGTASEFTNEATFDSAVLPSGFVGNQLAVLTVIFSDDATRINERIPVTQAVTHMGRSNGNEIVFSKDHPVSRHHAVLEYKDGQFLLSEALTGDESGMKSPTFGTFVNDEKISGSPIPVRNGDEIRMGNRLRLRFEGMAQRPAYAPMPEGQTFDRLN